MSKILPEFLLTEHIGADYVFHDRQTSNTSAINNLHSIQTLAMPKATRSNKLISNTKSILATILMIIIFVNVSKAQTTSKNLSSFQESAAEANYEKILLKAIQEQTKDIKIFTKMRYLICLDRELKQA